MTILVPKGFQGKQMLGPDGKCMTCKGTGGVLHKVWLEDPHVIDGKIISCVPKTAWEKCRCYMGAFWIRFHPINVQARLFPFWRKELNEALEREKARIISDCGGNYEPGSDTFLKDLGYRAPKEKRKVVSLDDIDLNVGF